MRKLEDAVRPVVAQKGWHASAVGLTRWIRRDKGARKADRAIAEAAERLWQGSYIGKGIEGNFFNQG